MLINKNLILSYQCILATIFVFVLFTNFDNYFNYAIGTPDPTIWLAIFSIASIPLLLSLPSRIKFISINLIYWICGYLVISLISFIIYSNYQPIESYMELRVRINSVIYMFLSLLIFSKYPRVQLWARRAILAITFINVIANIYGLYHPEAFVTIMERQSALATHRSSGFYVDSNRAACVLVLGMILSIDLLPQLYRWPFIFIIFIGIFPTFSRSAPIVFLFVIAILVLKRKIYINIKSFLSVTMIGIIAWLILSSGGTEWSDMGGFESDQKFQRINRVESFDISHPDSSSAARLSIAQITWNKFQESPIWGNGIGYGLRLAELHPELDTIRSHNMYLSFMVEHGFIGALFLPLLVFFSTQNAHGSNKSISLAFGVLIITWGFFSHNILDQREFLMAFSLMSTMNVYHECNVPTRTKLSRK